MAGAWNHARRVRDTTLTAGADDPPTRSLGPLGALRASLGFAPLGDIGEDAQVRHERPQVGRGERAQPGQQAQRDGDPLRRGRATRGGESATRSDSFAFMTDRTARPPFGSVQSRREYGLDVKKVNWRRVRSGGTAPRRWRTHETEK